MLADAYAWLAKEPGPRMLVHMRALIGLTEGRAGLDSPAIMAMAKRTGVTAVYKHDSIAWCGLAMLDAALASDKAVPFTPAEALWALNWRKFGSAVAVPMLGDVMVKPRKNDAGKIIGGHVCMYVGEDAEFYHCLGGNQGDALSIARIRRNANWTYRRPPYKVQPANVRVVTLAAGGAPAGGSEA